MIRPSVIGAAGAVICLSATPGLAHVTLDRPEAHIGAPYKAVVRVPHGCKGSPTTAIRIRMPAGVLGVKPMPKPGWKLSIVTGKYPKSFTLGGVPVSEGVTELSWSGGSLADAHYDEFVFVATIAQELPAGQTIHFPVVQECEQGVHRWIEIPSGKTTHGNDAHDSEPAPALHLLPQR